VHHPFAHATTREFVKERPVGQKATKLMDFDDAINKGKDFLENNKDKIEEALESDKAEDISDSALDAAAKFAKSVAPDGLDDKVDGARDHLDKSIGNE